MIWAQGCRSLLQLALCKRYQARLSPALRRRMGTCRRTHAKDVSMNSGHAERGLTTVDAYAQSKGACGGIDFWGNCWEWTSSTNADGLHIIKGGSWDSDRDDCRSEKSDVAKDGSQGYANVGFRVVRIDSN